MINNEFFSEKVHEAAETKTDIKEVHKANIGTYGKLFKAAFGQSPKDYKLILNMLFYKDGMPNETSKAKLGKVLEEFVNVAKYYRYLGKGSIIDAYLANFGVTISFVNEEVENTGKASKKKFDILWSETFPGQTAPTNKAELLQKLLDDGMAELTSVIALEKQINEEMSGDVVTKCELTSNKAFKKAVDLQVKKDQGKDVSEVVSNMERDADEMSQVLDVMGL